MTEGFVDAAAVAAHLDVERDYVYAHADELGAVRLGTGPKARLRFRLSEVEERLNACSTGRRSAPPDSRPEAGLVGSSRRRSGTSVDLLPIRGRPPR